MYAGILGAVMIMASGCNKDGDIIIDRPEDSGDSKEFSIIEYLPAPGQFINEKASGFEGIETMEQACRYAKRRFETCSYVSLGAWGGYIVVKAGRIIPNTGGYEFSIAGNAFDTSNEPGIVWVMEDSNGNGLPDDGWYELKGSYYGKEGYERNYSITYYRPADAQENVRWEACNGESGYINWDGTFHSQDFYYPRWVKEDSYTLYGSRLPDRAYLDPASAIWTNPPFEWGYADNSGEDSVLDKVDGKTVQKNYFRISDAVDESGLPVNLSAIDFIKVQTGVNGSSGVTGENSTEICGFFRE